MQHALTVKMLFVDLSFNGVWWAFHLFASAGSEYMCTLAFAVAASFIGIAFVAACWPRPHLSCACSFQEIRTLSLAESWLEGRLATSVMPHPEILQEHT